MLFFCFIVYNILLEKPTREAAAKMFDSDSEEDEEKGIVVYA